MKLTTLIQLDQTMLDIADQLDELVSQVNESGPSLLDEAAYSIIKRIGNSFKRYYRCTTGQRKGTYASSPGACYSRKDPNKVRHGKIVSRSSGAIRKRKSKITKKTSLGRHIPSQNIKYYKGKRGSIYGMSGTEDYSSKLSAKSSSTTKNKSTIKPKGTNKPKKPKKPK